MIAVLLSTRGVGVTELPEPVLIYRMPVPVFYPSAPKLDKWVRPQFAYRTYDRITVYPHVCHLCFYEEQQW